MLQRTAADDIAMAKRAGRRSLEAARQQRAANLRANRTLIIKISVAFVASMAAVLAALSTFANPNVIWFGAGMTFAGVCWLVAETLRGHEYRRLRDADGAHRNSPGVLGGFQWSWLHGGDSEATEHRGWAAPVEAFPGSAVEFIGDGLEVG